VGASCDAMGPHLCRNKDLQNNRHHCNACGKGMHTIGPCAACYDSDDDTYLCGLCHYSKDIDHGDRIPEVAAARPSQRSKDMLATEDSDEEADEEASDDEPEDSGDNSPVSVSIVNKKGKRAPPPSAKNRKTSPPVAAIPKPNAAATAAMPALGVPPGRKRGPKWSCGRCLHHERA
jgi:hypothetical protein